MHTRGANVFVVGAGKVTRLVAYWDRERALADLGLVREVTRADTTEKSNAHSNSPRAILRGRCRRRTWSWSGRRSRPTAPAPATRMSTTSLQKTSRCALNASRFTESKSFRGRAEFRRFIAELDQSWEGGAGGEIRELFPVGDRVVARFDWGGRGRTSGIDLHSSLTSICTVRDGQIAKIEYFFDHAQALEAAGRSE